MTDIGKVIETHDDWLNAGVEMVLATIVGVSGSSYRRPGARMLIGPNREAVGCISGGCLERDLVRKAHWYVNKGPVLKRYDADEDFQLGCGGSIEVLLERGSSDDCVKAMRWLRRKRVEQCAGVLATVVVQPEDDPHGQCRIARYWHDRDTEAERVVVPDDLDLLLDARRTELRSAWGHAVAYTRISRRSHCPDIGTLWPNARVLLESAEPPLQLFIFGVGADALCLARLAVNLGWQVFACVGSAPSSASVSFVRLGCHVMTDSDAVRERLTKGRRSFGIVMNHSLSLDVEALTTLIHGGAPEYVGVLGPRHRSERLYKLSGLSAAEAATVYSPVGLDLGADTPEEIALSIVAEMQRCLTRTSGLSLKRLAQTGEQHMRRTLAAE